MQSRNVRPPLVNTLLGFSLFALLASAAAAADLGTAFTYQGRLVKDGTPVTSSLPHCDFTFGLWDQDAPGGNQKGTSPQVHNGVQVTDGLFTVDLDFGSNAFDGQARWLEIEVQCPGDAGPTTLVPRQELTPAPHAAYSTQTPWTGLNAIPAGFADNVDNDTFYSASGGLQLTGTDFSVAVPMTLSGNQSGGPIIQAENTALDLGSVALLGKSESGAGVTTIAVRGMHGSAPAVLPGGGAGVFGSSDNAAGVAGFTTSSVGVWGLATALTGTTYGIFGDANSPDGYAGYFDGRGHFAGNLGVRTLPSNVPMHVDGGTEATLNADSGYMVIGALSGPNIVLDGNEIIARFNGTDTQLLLNDGSGFVGILRGSTSHPLHVGTNSANGNGAHLTAGGMWTNGSDRDSKEAFEALNPADILARVVTLPVTQWRYKGEPESVKHIGPVAQDFYAAFGTGGDERYIGTIDADGVALAAIQGLHQVVQEKDCEIEELRSRLEKLEQMLAGQKDSGR